MKISEIVLGSLAVVAGSILLASGISFANMGEMKGDMMKPMFSEEHFNEMKQMFMNNDFASFKTAMEQKHAEHQAKQAKFKDSVTREVTNIDNGIVMTMTSTDPEMVAKLQTEKENKFKNKKADRAVTHTKENIENGVRITITSSDADTVTRLQSKKEGKGFPMMRHGRKGGMRGMHNTDNE